MTRIGDIIEIPLNNCRFGYCQYVYKDSKIGPLIQLYDVRSVQHLLVEDVQFILPLFPPMFCVLHGALKEGLWKVIGKLPVMNFSYPQFITSHYDQKTGQVNSWFLWDGDKYTNIGKVLPNEMKHLEYLIGWNQFDIVERIEKKNIPFPYNELIKNNRFIPKKDK